MEQVVNTELMLLMLKIKTVKTENGANAHQVDMMNDHKKWNTVRTLNNIIYFGFKCSGKMSHKSKTIECKKMFWKHEKLFVIEICLYIQITLIVSKINFKLTL